MIQVKKMDYIKKDKVGEILIKKGLITEKQLEKTLEKQQVNHKKIGELLADDGIVTEEIVAQTLSEQLNLEMVDLQNIKIDKEIVYLVPEKILKKYNLIPYEFAKNMPGLLKVAMEDPLDQYAIDDISIITNYKILPVIATVRSIRMAIDKFYRQKDTKNALESYIREKNIMPDSSETGNTEEIDKSPVVLLVREMIENAVRQRASDIHIEPIEKQIRVRYRIDGVLYIRGQYDLNALAAIVTRIKIISDMDISEKRRPQDGRITQVVDHIEYDIRVSSVPTIHGEKIVMRLQEKQALTKKKQESGRNQHCNSGRSC